MNAARVAFAAAVAWLAYEALREALARNVRRNVPAYFRAEFERLDPSVGLLAPVLGTETVSRVVARVAEQTTLDTLPTLIGRKTTEPVR